MTPTRLARLARGQAGFTLTELLISAAVTGLLATGVGLVFQTTLRQVTTATALEEAQIGVRGALDRMADDLRLAGSYWASVAGAGPTMTEATATTVTFYGDVDGDTVVTGAETTLAAAAGVTVTLSGNGTLFNTYGTATLNDWLYVASGSLREVKQVSAVSGDVLTLAAAPVNTYPAGSIVRAVERVRYAYDAGAQTLTRQVGGTAEVIAENVTGMTLTYFDAAGASLGSTPGTLGAIQEIQATLTTRGVGGGERRTMVTRVRLRNV